MCKIWILRKNAESGNSNSKITKSWKTLAKHGTGNGTFTSLGSWENLGKTLVKYHFKPMQNQ